MCVRSTTGNSTVRTQSRAPVRRSKQYRFRFRPSFSAQVMKTRPCETMGLLLPGPGRAARHRTFVPGPQWSGALSSGATPLPSGPRNCGQSPALAPRDNSKASAVARSEIQDDFPAMKDWGRTVAPFILHFTELPFPKFLAGEVVANDSGGTVPDDYPRAIGDWS